MAEKANRSQKGTGRRRTSVRPPRQARSRAALDRILSTTEALLEKKFFDDLSVEEIAQGAGVSIGSFYARFPSKEVLLDALTRRYQEDADLFLATPEFEALAEAPLSERVAAVVGASVRRYRSNRGLLRGIYTYTRLHPEWAGESALASIDRMNRRLEQFMLASRDEIAHPDPARAVRLGLFFVSAVCREKVLFGEAPYARSTRVTDAQLAKELTRMFLHFLS